MTLGDEKTCEEKGCKEEVIGKTERGLLSRGAPGYFRCTCFVNPDSYVVDPPLITSSRLSASSQFNK